MRWGCKRHLRQTTTKPNHQLTAVVVARECNAMQVSYAERKKNAVSVRRTGCTLQPRRATFSPRTPDGPPIARKWPNIQRKNHSVAADRLPMIAKITVRAPTCRHDQKGGCAVETPAPPHCEDCNRPLWLVTAIDEFFDRPPSAHLQM
jgi:hypothetical protein